MEFRFCPFCGKNAMEDAPEVGGKRCRACHRPCHVIDLNRVPVDGGKQAKRLAAVQQRKAKKAIEPEVMEALPVEQPESDKGVSQ